MICWHVKNVNKQDNCVIKIHTQNWMTAADSSWIPDLTLVPNGQIGSSSCAWVCPQHCRQICNTQAFVTSKIQNKIFVKTKDPFVCMKLPYWILLPAPPRARSWNFRNRCSLAGKNTCDFPPGAQMGDESKILIFVRLASWQPRKGVSISCSQLQDFCISICLHHTEKTSSRINLATFLESWQKTPVSHRDVTFDPILQRVVEEASTTKFVLSP